MNSPTNNGESSPVTDSPFFWIAVFVVGAILALLLTAPKYGWRQPQIERQFQARQAGGQAVGADEGFDELSTTGNPALTLQPLMIFFCAALLVISCWFWWRRWVGSRKT